MKYILRVDNKYYRVKIRVGPQFVNKSFSFIRYGSEKLALTAAQDWRDLMLEKYGLFDRLLYKRAPHKFSNNETNPIIGISLSFNQSTKKWNWIAKYQRDNKEYKKGFSVDKYGSKIAFQKACEFRYEHCGILIVLDRTLMPCRPKVQLE